MFLSWTTAYPPDGIQAVTPKGQKIHHYHWWWHILMISYQPTKKTTDFYPIKLAQFKIPGTDFL